MSAYQLFPEEAQYMELKQNLLFMWGFVGVAMSLYLLVSPWKTIMNVITNKSIEKVSVLPYLTTLVDCIFTYWYDQPYISTNIDFPFIVINPIGISIQLVFVGFIFTYAHKRKRVMIIGLSIGIVIVFSSIALISTLAINPSSRNERWSLRGVATAAMSILTYGSNLPTIWRVKKTESTEYMSVHLSIAVTCCAFSWLVCGWLERDKFVYIPNAIGTLIGATQLVQYRIYCNNTDLYQH